MSIGNIRRSSTPAVCMFFGRRTPSRRHMKFTRILLISLMLASTAITVCAQTDQTAPDAQRTPSAPADQTVPASQTANPATDTAANPENIPLRVFKPDILMFGEPQADFIQHMQPVLFDLDV